MMSNDRENDLTVTDMLNLKHMLGIGRHIPKNDWGYRNHFLPGGDDIASMGRLEQAGYVRRGRQYEETNFFHATESGCEAAGLNDAQTRKALSD